MIFCQKQTNKKHARTQMPGSHLLSLCREEEWSDNSSGTSLAVLVTLSLSLSQVTLLPPGQLLTQCNQISRRVKIPTNLGKAKDQKNVGHDLYSQPPYMMHNK